MSEEPKIVEAAPPAKKAVALYFIAGFKIFKGILLLVAAAGIFSLAGKDLQDYFDNFLRWVHLDPENRFFSNVGDWLETITASNVRAVAVGTLIYGLFLCAGGTGLALRARWAIWLAIGESAFFIPIEIFELARRRLPDAEKHPHLFSHPRTGLAIVLAVNVFIVWYLFKNRERLFRHH